MTVNELLDTMTKPYRESLCDVLIDNEKLECIDDPEFLESEVDHWYVDNSKLYIFTRQFVINEIQKRNI